MGTRRTRSRCKIARLLILGEEIEWHRGRGYAELVKANLKLVYVKFRRLPAMKLYVGMADGLSNRTFTRYRNCCIALKVKARELDKGL